MYLLADEKDNEKQIEALCSLCMKIFEVPLLEGSGGDGESKPTFAPEELAAASSEDAQRPHSDEQPETSTFGNRLVFDERGPFFYEQRGDGFYIQYHPVLNRAGLFYLRSSTWVYSLLISSIALVIMGSVHSGFFLRLILNVLQGSPEIQSAVRENAYLFHYGICGFIALLGVARLASMNRKNTARFLSKTELTVDDGELLVTSVLPAGKEKISAGIPKKDLRFLRTQFALSQEATLELETYDRTLSLIQLTPGRTKGTVAELRAIEKKLVTHFFASSKQEQDL